MSKRSFRKKRHLQDQVQLTFAEQVAAGQLKDKVKKLEENPSVEGIE